MDALDRDEVLARLRENTNEILEASLRPQESACSGGTRPGECGSADERAAFQKILRCASVREQSTARMREKLRHAEFSDDAVERAIERAVELGIIDDRRYADALVRQTLASGKGLRFVLIEIEALGIDVESLDSYREHVDAGYEAEFDRAYSLLEKRPPRARNVREAAYRKLISKGYSFEISSSCARVWAERYEER